MLLLYILRQPQLSAFIRISFYSEEICGLAFWVPDKNTAIPERVFVWLSLFCQEAVKARRIDVQPYWKCLRAPRYLVFTRRL